MPQSELTISELASLFENPVFIENLTTCQDFCRSDEQQVAELMNGRPDGKIVLCKPGEKANQKFKFEVIEGTTKARIAVKTMEDNTIYVTSAKPVTLGDALTVSSEGTVYSIGWNGSGHTISTKGADSVELFWTLVGEDLNFEIELQPFGPDPIKQGWRFHPA